mmetsp:Transcript_28773/g.25474  ORF Transcript_28773/g.25474 Transcript_28773/m.25474 type:complete len:209 (+) Transcript_28773:770-1396(+)
MEEEDKVSESHVSQPDSKNSDIRSVKKEVLEFHQLIVEALAFSNTPEFISKQFKLYKSMYFSVSREIRLGILNNLNTLFNTICHSKSKIGELVEENKELYSFISSIVSSTQENLLQLSKILKTLVESLDSASPLRIKILNNIDEIFASKVKEDQRNKKKERIQDAMEEEIDEGGAIKIPINNQHDKLKEENKILTLIMQNYYLMKNIK